MNPLRRNSLAHGASLLDSFDRRSMAEVGVIAVLRHRIALQCKRNVLLLIHHLSKLIESNSLVSIDIQSAHNGNDLRLRSIPAVHAAEIHNVVVV